MNYEDVDPEIVPLLRKFPSLAFSSRSKVAVLKLLMPLLAKKTKMPAEVVTSDHDVGETFVRVYQPKNKFSDGALLWIHGGGMIIGTVGDSDAFCSMVALELGITVFSVDYRLAPRYPFPIPMDDCEAGYLWVLENATRFGFDSKKVALGGDSAGAGLAAGLAQRLLDRGAQLPIGQVLKYPMLDDRTATKRELDDTTFVWNNTSNHFGWKSYLDAEPGSQNLPEYAVPARRENLSGLPPAYIAVGEIDLFFNEDKQYADRLSAAAVEIEFNSYPGFPHAGELVSPEASVSKRFQSDLMAWLKARLQPTAS